jgi:nucleoid-associated protein YgaU
VRPGAVVAAVQALATEAKAMADTLAPAARGGALDARAVGGARASLAATLAAAKAVRRDLDGRDVLEHQVTGAAIDSIRLWQWERGTRSALVRLTDAALAVDARAAAWLAGQQAAVHVVHTGDTLQSVAARHLGGWEEWPRIAALNDLPPGPLRPGTVLALPTRR